MRTIPRPSPAARPDAAHRLYRDQDGTDTAFYRLVAQEDELLRLLAGVDRIALRQAPGAGWIPAAMTAPLLQALQSAALAADSPDPRAERVLREMRRRVADVLARIRIRCNRQLLAGITRIFNEDGDQHVLVLVFARRGVRSCEWQLAA